MLGDIGIHILDFATHVAGEAVADVSCRLTTFPKAPGERIGDYVLDANDAFTMQLTLASGALGTVSATRMATGHFNDLRLRLYGVDGGLEVSFEQGVSRLRACLGKAAETLDWTVIDCPEVPTNYSRFIDAVRGGARTGPDFARGAELQDWLDLALRSHHAGGAALAV